jgi:glycosyltransferase involved in cell wall biosynthesis
MARLLARLRLPGAWRYGFGSPYQIEQETFSWSLVRALRSHAFDIVHLQDPWLAYRLEQARRKGRHRARVILAHGTEEPLDFLRRFDHVQELAPYYLEQDRRAGIGGKHWFAIPNFVNAERFSPDVPPMDRGELGVAADAFMMLTVSAIKRTHKRLDVVIDAVNRVRQEHPERAVHLVVAGAREQESAEVMRFGKERLAGHITFLENFPRERMPGLYRAADVMVHGALVEMMPIALLEALASGLPVVAHRWPVLAWMIGSGGTCVDATRAEDLAAAIVPFLEPALRAERGCAARARAVAMFAEDVVVRQIVEMYAQVVGDGE